MGGLTLKMALHLAYMATQIWRREHEPGMSQALQVQAHLITDVCTMEGDYGWLAGRLVSRRSARRRALAAPVG